MTAQATAALPAHHSGFTRALQRVLATDANLASPILRATLGLVMLPHGAQKMLGLFGGHGFEATVGSFTQMGIPKPLGAGIVLLEFFGSMLILLGLGTRFVALAFVGLMIGAIAMVHAPHGFFMNWMGKQAGEGFEYHLLVIGIALALVAVGGGRFSLDRRAAAHA